MLDARRGGVGGHALVERDEQVGAVVAEAEWHFAVAHLLPRDLRACSGQTPIGPRSASSAFAGSSGHEQGEMEGSQARER
eukprot:scaffold209567_cov39-Tisochrysis_lutea.AAC.1